MKLNGVGIGIVGSPRSGTSSAAIFLERAGFFLGADEDIDGVDQFNPDGYREHREINALNEETDWIFQLPGETIAPLPDTWDQHPLADVIVERTRAVLASTFHRSSLWAWKDPRTTRLLPIYRRALSGVNVGYLVMLRRPMASARSIARRDGVSIDVGLGIWIDYTLCTLKYLRGAPCRFVYEREWLNSPQQPVSDLVKLMGVDPARLNLNQAATTVRPELRANASDESSDLGLAERCYEVAQAAATHPRQYIEGQLDGAIDELWDEWQGWRELRNSRRDQFSLNLATDRGEASIFAGAPGPLWRPVSASIEAKEARLIIRPLGTSVFIKEAALISKTGQRIPLRFGNSKGASCGWSAEGIGRICPWTSEGLPILLPRPGSYTLELKVQGYPTITSAIMEAMSQGKQKTSY